MARFFKKREQQFGQVPGSLIFIGTQKIAQPRIDVIEYNKEEIKEHKKVSLDQLTEILKNDRTFWINFFGIHDTSLISKIGEMFNIHPLAQEDIVNTAQRAKFEEFDDFYFLALKMLKYNEQIDKIVTEHLSIFVKDNVLVTFQEEKGNIFDPVRDRIRKNKGRIRSTGANYLSYVLIDTVIENYVMITERIGEKIEDIESDLIENANKGNLHKIENFKRELSFLAKVIKPVKELILKYIKFMNDEDLQWLQPYIRDMHDLYNHTLESIETYRELLNDYLQIYHSNISYKMNDIMKILTIFSAVFIPMTFLAGVYGMNFEHIPELSFKFSYPIFWGIIIILGISMLLFFKRKKWI